MPAADLVGRSFAPDFPYEVSRSKIREFAAAIGDRHPAYYDVAAAQSLGHPDLVAPPTFAIVATLPASEQLVRDLGLDFASVVHGDQRFTLNRPIYAGDVLHVTVTVERARTVAGNTILTTRSDITDAVRQPVGAAYTTLVIRESA